MSPSGGERKTKKKASKGRRRPSQARSKATVEAILVATAQVLERSGPEAATTKAIAARAGVSVGSLYQYFGGRDELIDALARRHVESMRRVLTDALAELISLPLEAAIPRLMTAVIAAHRLNPRLDHVLHQMIPMSNAAILDDFQDFTATVTATALRTHPDTHVEDPELAGSILAQAIAGVLRSTLRRFPERLQNPALERQLADLVLGFLDRQGRAMGP